MKTKWMIYQELELISQPEPNLRLIKARLREFWWNLIAALTRKPEMQIWQTVDRDGNTWWNVYDPTTGESATLDSEQKKSASGLSSLITAKVNNLTTGASRIAQLRDSLITACNEI